MSEIVENLKVLLLFAIIPIALTDPLVLHLDDSIIAFSGHSTPNMTEHNVTSQQLADSLAVQLKYGSDVLSFLHTYHSVHTCLREAKILNCPKPSFYPETRSLNKVGEAMPSLTFTAAFLLEFLELIEAHNILILFLVFLSGLSAYCLFLHFTEDKVASAAGAIIYTISPYVTMKILIGHTNLLALHWIPLIFLFLEKNLTKPSIRNASALGILACGQILSCAQYTVYIAFVAVVYAAVRKPSFLRKNIKWLVFSAALSAFLSSWYLIEILGGEHAERNVSENIFFSAKLEQLLSTTEIDWEHQVFIGPLPIIFAVLGIHYNHGKKIRATPFLATAAFSLLMMLGPFDKNSPYQMIYEHLPLISAFRTPIRFFPFFLISLAAISSMVISLFKENRTPIFIVVLLVTYAGLTQCIYSPPFSTYAPLETEEIRLYEHLATLPGNFTIVEYPNLYRCHYPFHALIHGKNVVGGCSGKLPPSFVNFTQTCGNMVLNIRDPACREKLSELNVKYLVYHSEDNAFVPNNPVGWDQLYAELQKDTAPGGHLKEVAKYGEAYLFEIV